MTIASGQLSPGVYKREIDLSTRIKTNSTTIAAIVGASKKGRVNETVLVTSGDDFIAEFGRPDPKVSMMHYSALSFLEEGGLIYVTRAVKNDALTAGVYLTVDDPIIRVHLKSVVIETGATYPDYPIDESLFYKTDNVDTLGAIGLYVWRNGKWRNVNSASVDNISIIVRRATYPTSPREGVLFYKTNNTDTLGAAGYYIRIDSAWVSLALVDSATVDPIIRLTNFDDGSSNALGVYDPIHNLGFSESDPAAQNLLLYICAANPGEWNNSISIQVRPSNSPGIPVGTGHDVFVFYIDVFVDYTGPGNRPVESFVVNRAPDLDGFGRQLFVEDVINNTSNHIRVKNNPYCDQVPITRTTFEFMRGASDGTPIDYYDVIRAWDLYTDVERLSLSLLLNGGYSNPEVQTKMNAIATARQDCVALLDIPFNVQANVDTTLTYRENLNIDSNYAAIYTPDVLIRDPYNGIDIYVPLSGFAAAICARTDRTSFLWNAPAGLTRGKLGVKGLYKIYNQEARDALDDAQINMLRYFSTGQGIVMWAQNTMQIKASALSNLNVRRLLNFLENRIAATALYSVFETNSRFLRSELTAIVQYFLKPIKNNHGLLDYKVVCDDTNNTFATIANGECILDVYLDPTLPAKRIHLNAIITKTGSLFSETVLTS